VLLEVGALREDAGGLDDPVHAQVLPLQVRGVLLGGDAHRAAVDDERAFADRDRAFEAPVRRVELQEVRERRGVGEVVDRDHFEARVGAEDAEHEAPDAPEPVDRHAMSHVRVLLSSVRAA
jgi:hypothetical protein